jgi:glycosyltransferase involved in cell wall biosynthesis
VSSFIVQTEVVRDALERCYPGVSNRTHVIAQPVPSWLLQSGLRRKARARASGQALNLIYPAAGYPHKNHTLLSHLDPSVNWPVEQLVLTLDAVAHPAPGLSWVHCGGFLSPAAMIAAYSQYDALLFLSKAESYGFPLVEAMFVGLPIVCPDLPYAHTLCGDQAFYFNPDQPESLRQALLALQSRLDQGWWPNWQDQLINIPSDWDIVARKILEVACGSIV